MMDNEPKTQTDVPEGVAHIPGSLWSWAPDGNEAHVMAAQQPVSLCCACWQVKGTFVLQPDGTLSWKAG